jgi:hypothetical protein
MSAPIELSRKAYDLFEGERWNALIQLLATTSPDETTPIQRVAFLTWTYNSEVLNGGHDQYFASKNDFDHSEVIEALKVLGASCQSDILGSALAYVSTAQTHMPEGYDEFISWDKQCGYSDRLRGFDLHFYDCHPEIEPKLLDAYLDANESAFVKWKP